MTRGGAERRPPGRSTRAIVGWTTAALTLGVVGGVHGPHAGGQAPAPIGEYVHDLYDQRYRPPAERGGAQVQQGTGPHRHHHAPAGAPAPGTGAHDHGTPPGWKFTLPKGDPEKGRAVFVKLECYACHEVRGQTFPGVKDAASLGPELSEMAAHHEAEFFAEAIVNPNALIDEPQWSAPDGTSRMPSFNDSLTVQELVDLVAFLKSLTPPAAGGGHRH